jgi:hypothetical protein
MIDIRQLGCGGLCVGIFSSLQGWLCVGVLCALQCAKNSVGSGRQSHGCLYMCRMFNRVTYNICLYERIIDIAIFPVGIRIGDIMAFSNYLQPGNVQGSTPFLQQPIGSGQKHTYGSYHPPQNIIAKMLCYL